MWLFQSTRPVKGATASAVEAAPAEFEFQSTRPVKGATWSSSCENPVHEVSIHAPREGRDAKTLDDDGKAANVSIHAPREGRDSSNEVVLAEALEFQSTRPVKGATAGTLVTVTRQGGFNPRAP